MRKKKVPTVTKDLYEKKAWEAKSTVCGIDEVGRGCLAGPLVTAAVILHKNSSHELLKDSKLMTPAQREKASVWIKKQSWYSIGIVHSRIIDTHNIWQATLMAMKKALLHTLATSPNRPSAILVDAMPLDLSGTNYADIPVHSFTQGESKSSSIAAASIIAKVTRDQLMEHFDSVFPGYHLKDHKGYATKIHKSAILDQHHTIIHRTSFLRKTLEKTDNEKNQQQRFC